MGVPEVLGIPVRSRILRRWREWFAPETQPFRTDLLSSEVAAAVPDNPSEPTEEWRDTFFMYGGTWTWLDEDAFLALRPSHRRACWRSGAGRSARSQCRCGPRNWPLLVKN